MVARDINLIESEIDPPRNLGSAEGVFFPLCRDVARIFQQLKLKSDDLAVVEAAGIADPYAATPSNEWQDFWVVIQRNTVIQHKFIAPNQDPVTGTIASSNISAINAPSNTFVNTPVGDDTTTPFVSGAKVGFIAADAHMLYLDTTALTLGTFGLTARVKRGTYSLTTETGTIQAQVVSRNVNGVTRDRLHLRHFRHQSDGTEAIGLTTFGEGTFTVWHVRGWMPPFS